LTRDPTLELKAMSDVSTALATLPDTDAQKRVLQWVIAHFEIDLVPQQKKRAEADRQSAEQDGGAPRVVADVATLFDSAHPETETDRALVIGYWFQQVKGKEDFGSQQVNGELKDLGHEVTNITRAFDTLQSRTPRLARQVRKEGTSKQARKRYKLTAEGIRHVEQMLGFRASPGAADDTE
jgi:hypothetical protein